MRPAAIRTHETKTFLLVKTTRPNILDQGRARRGRGGAIQTEKGGQESPRKNARLRGLDTQVLQTQSANFSFCLLI